MNHLNYPKESVDYIFDSKILVVDDEETNVRLLEHLLLQNGYRSVRWTTDPRDVEQIYRNLARGSSCENALSGLTQPGRIKRFGNCSICEPLYKFFLTQVPPVTG